MFNVKVSWNKRVAGDSGKPRKNHWQGLMSPRGWRTTIWTVTIMYGFKNFHSFIGIEDSMLTTYSATILEFYVKTLALVEYKNACIQILYDLEYSLFKK